MNNKKKIRTAQLSIASNSVLIVMKVFAGFFTGSVSIISEAIHSALDLVAAFIAFLAVRVSDKPADVEHPFGHGKYENVSGVIEALLIFGAAVWIIFEALDKLLHTGHLTQSNSLNIGIIVMFISGTINFFVSRRLYKVAKETDSVALEADALHLKTDVYTSVGVGVGLLLIQLTGYMFLDPIVALLVALFIIKEAYDMLIKSFNPLLDSSLNKEELLMVKSVIADNIPKNTKVTDIRTRKSGHIFFVNLILILDSQLKIQEAVEIRDEFAKRIKSEIDNIELIIILDS